MATGRSAHRADRRTRSPRTSWRAAVATTSLAMTLPLAAAGLLWASDVPLRPPAPAVVPVAAPAPTETVRTVTAVEPPAVAASRAILAAGPGRGWAPAGPAVWATTSVVESTCPATDGPAPTLTGQRSFTRGRGGVTAAVLVFGAGQGGRAFDLRRARLSACSQDAQGVAAWSLRTGTVSAIAAVVRPAGTGAPISSLTWRRGDVLLSVLAPAGTPEALVAQANAVDATAVAALTGRCVDLAAPSTAASRSPWVDRDAFTGLLVQEDVRIEPLGLPAPPVGVVPVPLDRVVVPPAAVVLPTRPADPVWPDSLPAPVAQPVPPVAPGPEPTSTRIATARRDPVGPGCGWAFTGQSAPTFDGVGAAAERAAQVDAARTQLVLQQQAWRTAVVGYWQASARYDAAVLAYARYAQAVRQTRVAWAAIERARAEYQQALVEYDAAVAARTRWLADRAAAEATYRAAVAACAVTPPVVPAPAVTGTAPAPAAPPVPVAPSCPPTRPAILDQPVPPVPVAPTPPPDPRPLPPTVSAPASAAGASAGAGAGAGGR